MAFVIDSSIAVTECIAALTTAVSSATDYCTTLLPVLQVRELGVSSGGKGAKTKSKEGPQYSEVCEACKPYLDAGTEMPLDLLAQLIKFRLLAIKDADMKRRHDEKVLIILYYSAII